MLGIEQKWDKLYTVKDKNNDRYLFVQGHSVPRLKYSPRWMPISEQCACLVLGMKHSSIEVDIDEFNPLNLSIKNMFLCFGLILCFKAMSLIGKPHWDDS